MDLWIVEVGIGLVLLLINVGVLLGHRRRRPKLVAAPDEPAYPTAYARYYQWITSGRRRPRVIPLLPSGTPVTVSDGLGVSTDIPASSAAPGCRCGYPSVRCPIHEPEAV